MADCASSSVSSDADTEAPAKHAFDNPCHALAVGAAIYVADHGNNRVEHIDDWHVTDRVVAGKTSMEQMWPSQRVRSLGTADSGSKLFRPIALLVSGTNLYVAERASGRVTVFPLTHALGTGKAAVRTIGLGYGAAPGQLAHPCGLALHAGRLFVSEAGNHRLSTFNAATGAHLSCFGDDKAAALDNPTAVVVDDECGITVASYCKHQLVRFSLEGAHKCSYAGSDDDPLHLPWGLALCREKLVVSEHFGKLRLLRLASLEALRVITIGMAGVSILKHVCLREDDGALLVCDSGQHCVLAVRGFTE